jgi:hypothetical protein
MIGVFLTFRYTDSFDPELIRHIAQSARPTFEGRAGLRSKAFTLNVARREAVNFYIWESEAASRAMASESMMERVTALYGVRPTVDVVEIPVLVDNAAADRGRGTGG